MNQQRQLGFSIVELLIAVVLGLILTVGLISVFVNSKQGYRVQESRSRMQENGRFALDYLSRAVRLADFWGSVAPAQISLGSTDIFSGACGILLQTKPTSAAVALVDGVRGYEGAATAPTDVASCITNYVPQSDVIVVRYAEPDSAIQSQATQAATTTAISAAAANAGGAFIRVLVGKSGTLFDALSSTALSAATSTAPYVQDGATSPGALITYKYRAEAYYLRVFDATLPQNQQTQSLYYSRNLSNTSAPGSTTQATALVDGIEMMQLEYGVDTDGDLVADRYQAAASVSDWAQVISVRINLIVRGDSLDNFTDSSTYAMAGGYSYTPAASIQRFQRLQVVKEVQIRNRVKLR